MRKALQGLQKVSVELGPKGSCPLLGLSERGSASSQWMVGASRAEPMALGARI